MKTGLSQTKAVLKFWGMKEKRRQFCCTFPISSPPSPMPTFSFISPLAQLGFAANSRSCYTQSFDISKGGSVLFVCIYIYMETKINNNLASHTLVSEFLLRLVLEVRVE